MVVKRRGGAPRVVARAKGEDLFLDDGRSIRWSLHDGTTNIVEAVATDRSWVVLVHHRSQRPEACEGLGLRAYDVSHGRGGRRARSCEPPSFPPPHAGDAIVVTDGGAAAWIADGRLLVELDRGETIGDLRAQRDAVAWTRGGVPSSAVPVG